MKNHSRISPAIKTRILSWLFLDRPWIRRLAALGLATAAVAAVAQNPLVRPEYQLTLVDREGRRKPVGRVPGSTFAPRISPNGREVVFDTNEDGNIWVAPMSDVSQRRRLTTSGRNRGPLWSGDGARILYVTDDEGAETLFWRRSDGTGSAELLTKPARAPESWSPREDAFSFITFKQPGDYDVWLYRLKEKRATPFVAVAVSPQHSSHFSSDGRWIAYVSAESGRLEVYVEAVEPRGPRIQVTTEGGAHPLWSPDRKELFFDNNGQMFAVPITSEAPFKTGTPVALPIRAFIQGPLRRQYDLMPDGKQFLMLFSSAAQ